MLVSVSVTSGHEESTCMKVGKSEIIFKSIVEKCNLVMFCFHAFQLATKNSKKSCDIAFRPLNIVTTALETRGPLKIDLSLSLLGSCKFTCNRE